MSYFFNIMYTKNTADFRNVVFLNKLNFSKTLFGPNKNALKSTTKYEVHLSILRSSMVIKIYLCW